MENLTYGELLKVLHLMPTARLKDTVSVRIGDEFYPVKCTGLKTATVANDVLDEGHLYIEV